MGRALAKARPEAMAVWDEAKDVLGFDLTATAWEGPEEALTRTDIAQPALLTASIAAFRVLEPLKLRVSALAGHSAGEYAALVAAGSLTFSDAMRVIRARGEAMQKASEYAQGGMAAVLGADSHILEALCEETGGVVPANLNAPGQVVVSGTAEALDALEDRAKAAGARRFIRLKVAGPFHSPAMAPAAEAVRAALTAVNVQDPVIPIYSNVTAMPAIMADEVRSNLIAQVTGRVRWEETIRNIASAGTNRFVELGVGRVLTGLVQKIHPSAEVHAVSDPETLASFLEAIEE